MSRPKIRDNGEIDIKSVESLSFDELLGWVRERLHREDLIVPGGTDAGEMPHYLLASLYTKVDRFTRQDLEIIVLQFLRNLANDPASEWIGEPGSELMMLTDPMLVQSSSKEEAIDLLLDIANSGHPALIKHPDTRLRALQSLVTLEHRASVAFWYAQYLFTNDKYASVILEGLALIDVNAPFAWLKQVEWTEPVEDAIINILPSLLEDYGAAKVSSAIEKVLPDLSAQGSKSLKAFCVQEGITLDIADNRQAAHSSQAEDSTQGLEELEEKLDQIIEGLSPESRGLLEMKLRQRYSTYRVATKIALDDGFPLSYPQQRVWFLSQFNPGNTDYNKTEALLLTGTLDTSALERSINEVIARHESLRARFMVVDGQPLQIISPHSILSLAIIDVPEAGWEEKIPSIVAEEFNRPFDLAKGPLARAKLVRMAEDKHVLLLTVHQIVCDDWSLGVFIKELGVLYGAFLAGEPSPLPELPIQYRDYTERQMEWLQGKTLESPTSYWRRQLDGELPVIELPTDFQRPAVGSGESAKCSLLLPGDMIDELENISRRKGVTLFMTLLAALNILLYRYTGIKDITVGTSIANRNRGEIEDIIGLFADTLVLRTNLSGNPTFEYLLDHVRAVLSSAYAHQDLPFEKLVEELQQPRSLSQNPLFQVTLDLKNTPRRYVDFPGLHVTPIETDSATSKLIDLALIIAETEQGLLVTAEYRADLFEATTVQRILKHYHTLLQSAVMDPNSDISDLPILTREELHQIEDWNRTEVAYSVQQECIHQLFEAQVERTPEAVAVVFEKEQLKYRELNQRANRLARHIQSLGVGPEVHVGLCAERSIEMIVGLLAILKAGGAFVSMDPGAPKERLAFQVTDGEMPIVLTQSRITEHLPEEVQAIRLDGINDQITEYSDENLLVEVPPENLAYIIYTSGSTGKPKGVMVSHQAVCNHLLWMQSTFPLSKDDRTLYKYPITYDVSVVEIFGALLSGAQLIITRPDGHQDDAYIAKLISEKSITAVDLVPYMLQMLLESYTPQSYKSLKRVICGGEALTGRLLDHFFNKIDAELYNIYGPTETTIGATYWMCKPGYQRMNVPIGRPIANTKTYILDTNLNLISVGVTGELYIGGIALARGYFNRPDLTAERFRPNPFSREPGARLYSTGDLARYLPDGSIEFLGRIDHQVKIRGLRIEPGEIEAVLREHEKVREAVVVVREDAPGGKSLVAYIASSEKSAGSADELRRFLKKKLPEYMTPRQIVFIDEIPLTPNGKVDRRSLPLPETMRAVEMSYVEPRSLIEKEIAAVWSEVLGHDRVGIYDNFFDLGGHSLLATRVVIRLKEMFEKEISLLLLFENPTVAGLTKAIVGNTALKSDEAMKDISKLKDLRQVLTELEQFLKKDYQ